jgi:hypothetical protein
LVVAASAWAADREEFNPGKKRTTRKIRAALPFHNDTREVEVDVVNGQAVLEGDIVLGRIDQVAIPPDVSAAVAIKGAQYRWPNGVMPYELGSGFSQADKDRIQKAIQHINSKTKACIVPKKAGHKDYVRLIKSSGCWSYVGRQGGRQDASVPSGCGFGSTVHELTHALGMWHEQSRSDRDNHVTIKWENIIDSKKHNFNKHIADGIDIGSYDCGSIMHYGPTAFTKNGKATIVGKTCKSFGQRSGLSSKDIAGINTIYASATCGGSPVVNIPWYRMPGAAHDIGVGSTGAAWVIGTNKESGGYGIYRWLGPKSKWKKIPGSAVRIDVGPKDTAWVVNSKRNIYRYTGKNWQKLPGAAYDIGVGANGTAWVIGTNKESGGYGIYRWQGKGWKKIPGSAVRIDVEPNGRAWVVNKNGNIYRYTGSKWQKLPGRARDIGIGANGTVWVLGWGSVGGGYSPYKWNGKGWTKHSGGLTNISADPRGYPWGVNSARNIYADKRSPFINNPPAFATTPGPRAKEDCVGFNPNTTTVKEINKRWKIVDGSHWMFDFEGKEGEAKKALAIIKHYRMNKSCFVGRPNPSFSYMLVNNGAPRGAMKGEDCVSFNPRTAQVKQISNRWKIVDGNHMMFDFAKNAGEARESLGIIKKYGFTRSCFVGRPGPSFEYLRR